jgi:hypothetical protein
MGGGAGLARVQLEVSGPAGARPRLGLVEQSFTDAAGSLVGIDGELLDPHTPTEADRLEVALLLERSRPVHTFAQSVIDS